MRTSRHYIPVSGTAERIKKAERVHLYVGTVSNSVPMVLGEDGTLTPLDMIDPSLQRRLQWMQKLLSLKPFIPAHHQLPFASILPPNPICFHPFDDIACPTVEVLLVFIIIGLDAITFRRHTLSEAYRRLLKLVSFYMVVARIHDHKISHPKSNEQPNGIDQDRRKDRIRPVICDWKRHSQ